MEENPWEAVDLEQFLFFCCPECDSKCKEKEGFLQHAIDQHENARQVYKKDPLEEITNSTVVQEVKRTYSRCKKKGQVSITDPCGTPESDQVQCYYCCMKMLNKDIYDHIWSLHGSKAKLDYGPEKPFQCAKCKYALNKIDEDHICAPNALNFDKKLTRKISKNKFKCSSCNIEFKNEKHWTLHMSSVHDFERNFPCNQCNFKAKTNTVLQRHIKRIHDKEFDFVCLTCGDKFFHAYNLRIHQQQKHQIHNQDTNPDQTQSQDNQELQCELCDKTCIGTVALNTHKSLSHGIETTNQKLKNATNCNQCGKLVSNNNLKSHQMMYHPTVDQIEALDSKCDKCGLTYKEAFLLNDHQRQCLETIENFTCKTCSSTGWHSAKTLRNHIAQQHSKIVTVCDIGGCILHSFIDVGIIEHKRRVHDKVKPYSCDFCDKSFGSKLTLKSHVGNIHKKSEQKFKCDFCHFTCLAASRLKVHHQAVHVKKIKFQCAQCPFFSYRKTGLQNHVKVVHEKYYPHECDFCQMSFAYKREKIKHMEKVHDTSNI